jgi:hypothetical protein
MVKFASEFFSSNEDIDQNLSYFLFYLLSIFKIKVFV